MAELTIPEEFVTREEYLARERVALERSEFYRGRTCLMRGAQRAHSLILTALVGTLERAFGYGQGACEVHFVNMRVHVLSNGLFTYPDVAVVLGVGQYLDEEDDTLLNPAMIIEVMSPLTEAYDRGKKFQLYRGLSTLREYVLVSQSEPLMERFSRQPDGRWVLSIASGPEAWLDVETFGVTFDLSYVYRRVSFEVNMQLRLFNGELIQLRQP